MKPTILEDEDGHLGTMLGEGVSPYSHLCYHPGENGLFMGYHPVLYFNPKVFNDLTNVAMAVEVTNRVHALAWSRIHLMITAGFPPPGVPARPSDVGHKWKFTPAYTQNTVSKLEDTALFYAQALYRPPVVTANDRIDIPSCLLDKGPLFWMGAGGLVSRLLCGLMYTSRAERERLFLAYPQFWTVTKCVNLELPCEGSRWLCDCGHHGPKKKVRVRGRWSQIFCF